MPPKIWRINSRTLLLIAMVTISGVVGLADGLLVNGALLETIYIGALVCDLFLVFAWYRSDARWRSFRRSRALDICVIAFMGVALPYYLFRSRGLRRGFLATAGAIAFMLASWLVAGTGALVGHYATNRLPSDVVEFPNDGSGEIAYRRTVLPHYPIQLALSGVAGTAQLLVLVGADGKPKKVTLESGTGHPELDAEAIKAVNEWEFYPKLEGGKPVEASAIVPVVFKPEAD